MTRTLKRHYQELVNAPAGERFGRYRRCRRIDEQLWVQILYLVAGVASIVLGVMLSVAPVLPGFVLVLVGIGIIAARSAPVAKIMDRTELALRRYARAITKKIQKRGAVSADRDR